MDPTSNNNNPFVSTTQASLHSELAEPKVVSASAVDPAAAYASSAGLSGIAPLNDPSVGSGFNTAPGSAPYSGYSGLGGIQSQPSPSAKQYNTAQDTSAMQYTAQDTTPATSARDAANNVSDRTRDAANNVSDRTRDVANNVSDRTRDVATNVSDRTSATIDQVSSSTANAAQSTRQTAQNISDKASATASDAATGIRQRVRKLSVQLDNAADHPAVKNAKGVANSYVVQLREQLGRSKTVRELEARTNIDRVFLVVGGAFAYLLLIPLNLFGLALPITNILTILPAAYLSAAILDDSKADVNDERVKQLLAYFVVLGLIQTTESLAAGVMERRIPQYYTVKLLALAYLLHPRTKGALQVHENVFRPLVQRATAPTKSSSSYSANDLASTPPTSKPSLSNVNSPALRPTAQTSGYAVADDNTAPGAASGFGAGATFPAAGEPILVVPVAVQAVPPQSQQQY